jgi:hypothetical protein
MILNDFFRKLLIYLCSLEAWYFSQYLVNRHSFSSRKLFFSMPSGFLLSR